MVLLALCSAATAESGWKATREYAEPTRPGDTAKHGYMDTEKRLERKNEERWQQS